MGMVVNKSLAQTLTKTVTKSSTSNGVEFSQFTNKKGLVIKSQLSFKDKIDNSNLPFIPKLRHKPNALRPLPG